MPTPKAKYEITAEDKTAEAWRSALNHAEGFSEKLKSTLLPLAGGAAIGAFVGKLALDSLALAKETKDLSERMQVTITEASKMDDAFQKLGGSTESLENGFREFRLTMSDAAHGKDSAIAVFEGLGLGAEKLRALKPTEQLIEISKAFEGIVDPIERARVANELFGKAGKEWIPVLAEGSEKLIAFTDAAVALDERGTLALDRVTKANAGFWKSFKTGVVNVAGITISAFMDDTRSEISQLESDIQILEARATSIRKVAVSGGQLDKADQYEAEAKALKEVLAAAKMRKEWDDAAARRNADATTYQGIDPTAVAHQMAIANAESANSESELLLALQKTNSEYEKRWAMTQDGAQRGAVLGVIGDAAKAEQENLKKLMDEDSAARKEYLDGMVEYRVNSDKEATDKINQYQVQAQRNTQNIIADSIKHGFETGADGALKAFGQMLLDMAAQAVAADLATSIFGGKNSNGKDNAGLISTIFSGASSWFSGARAGGGPVSGGQGYLVGEQGPELFMPSSSGSIVPNHALGGGSGVAFSPTYNVTVGANNAVTRGEVVAAMKQTVQLTIGTLKDMQRRGAY